MTLTRDEYSPMSPVEFTDLVRDVGDVFILSDDGKPVIRFYWHEGWVSWEHLS